MLKFSFNISIFLMVIYNSGVVAQTTPELVLPKGLHGAVRLNISTISNWDKETLGYNDLSVYVKNQVGEYVSNAIQGQHIREDDYLVFKPYFPFESGMIYIVRTKKTKSHSNYSFQSFQIGKKKKVEGAKILSIYPSASQLPENLLRFYIYFNTPMKKGEALKHIKLIDAEGNIDSLAFMEFKQELWSIDGKRLTVLFDPGRIKRGVSTNMLRGSALLKGKQYRLSISDAWQDVYGQKLSDKTTKEIEVVKAYRHRIKENEWLINKLQANSYDTLTMHFDRIMDHALIQSMIQLMDPDKNPVDGYWGILKQEQLIQFIPEKKWQKGKYQIVIDSRLEDVAGNNLQNLLDHDKTEEENESHPYHFVEVKI